MSRVKELISRKESKNRRASTETKTTTTTTTRRRQQQGWMENGKRVPQLGIPIGGIYKSGNGYISRDLKPDDTAARSSGARARASDARARAQVSTTKCASSEISAISLRARKKQRDAEFQRSSNPTKISMSRSRTI